jgi:hypothetical protein
VRLPLSRPRMWAHPLPKNPLKLPYDPPYLPCPKNWKPIAMQDVQTTNLNLARRPFLEPSSATGSTSRHLHHDCPWATFHPEPPGRPFFISWPGTQAHCHIDLIHVHICYSLQILFTLGIWLFCVQVLGHHLFTSFLQVYT